MSKIKPVQLTCKHCGSSTFGFHRLVPHDDLAQMDIVARISGCKQKPQDIVCPECGKSDFEVGKKDQ